MIFSLICMFRFRLIEVERKSNEYMLVPNYMGSAFSSLPYCRKVIIQVLEQMTACEPRFIDALKLFSSIWLKSQSGIIECCFSSIV